MAKNPVSTNRAQKLAWRLEMMFESNKRVGKIKSKTTKPLYDVICP